MLSKARDIVYQCARWLILILFGAIIFYLVYLAGFSTSYINWGEHSYLVGDSFIKNLVFVAAVLFVSWICYKKIPAVATFISRVNEDKEFSDKCRKIGLYIIGVIAFAFVLVTQTDAYADSYDVNKVANAWLDKDYTALDPGGYINHYPSQLGIVLILYFFYHIFGSFNFLVFQFCNVLALVFLYKTFADISDDIGGKRILGLAIIIGGIFFLPGIFYTTFVYGTVIGLSCSVLALKYVMQYEKDKSVKNLILAGLLLFLAVIIKNNYLIFAIGLGVYIFIRLLKKPGWHMGLAIVMVLAILLFGNSLVKGAAHAITGKDVGKGTASLSWLAMGLQDDSGYYDGWYNGYNYSSYEDSGFDSEKQSAVAKSYIKERLEEFQRDPEMALVFFARKNASQWNNPSFQGMWINQSKDHAVRYPYYIYYLISEAGSAKVTSVMNYFQFFLLVGALLFVVLRRKKSDALLFYEVVVIGGFVFHTFWEAKCQYTLPYFMLLIPLSVEGFGILCEKSGTISLGSLQCKKYIVATGLFLIIACIIRFGNTKLGNYVFLKNDDTEAFEKYISERTYVHVKTGSYALSTGNDSGGSIMPGAVNPDNPAARGAMISDQGSVLLYIRASEADDNVYICLENENLCLDVPDSGASEGLPVQFSISDNEDWQKWNIRKSSVDGKVNIIYQSSWALTYDTGSGAVFLSQLSDSENQQWGLEEKKRK